MEKQKIKLPLTTPKRPRLDPVNLVLDPSIPFVENFIDSDNKVNIVALRFWCLGNNCKFSQQPFLTGSIHKASHFVARNPEGNVIFDGFNKSSSNYSPYVEVLYAKLFEHFNLPSPTVYYCREKGDDRCTLSLNVIDKPDCRLIDAADFLNGSKTYPTDNPSSSNSLFDLVRSIKKFEIEQRNSQLPNPILSPNIYSDLLKLAIVDFCFGQNDRHSHNYGFTYNRKDGSLDLAPPWDNGNACGLQSYAQTSRLVSKNGGVKYFDSMNMKKLVGEEKFGGLPFYGVRFGLLPREHSIEYIEPSQFIREFESPQFRGVLQEIDVDFIDLKQFVADIKRFDFKEEAAQVEDETGVEIPTEVTDIMDTFKSQRSTALYKSLTHLEAQEPREVSDDELYLFG